MSRRRIIPIITPMAPKPQYQSGFYATNNPYQMNGLKGFTEFKSIKETNDLYLKLDLPGIKKESVLTLLEPSENSVTVTGEAPKESKHDSSHRKYKTTAGLSCDCCVISNIQCVVEDGVVRLILSKKKKMNLYCSANIICGYNPEDPALTGPIILPHPSVLEGSTSAYESKRLSKGGLFLRIDMPGVPKDSFVVAVDGYGYVTVMGRAPATMHDLSGRHYVGKVAIVPRGYDGRQIKVNAKDGVVRLIIRP